jgi:adenylate cyclase
METEKEKLAEEKMVHDFWYSYNMGGPPPSKKMTYRLFRFLPSEHRCKWCRAPFDGASGNIVKSLFRIKPSVHNSHYCNICDEFANKYQGGAEVPIAMFFADMRGSTTIAEKIGPIEFSKLINRFFVKVTHVLSYADALIEKLVGDEVAAFFNIGISGENYPLNAINAGIAVLKETGHEHPDGPWAPVGIGIHIGDAFVGSVGNPNGMMEVAVLGDVPNTASRLTSEAKIGEIIVSEETMNAAGFDKTGLEMRTLELKGKSEKINAFVIKVGNTKG